MKKQKRKPERHIKRDTQREAIEGAVVGTEVEEEVVVVGPFAVIRDEVGIAVLLLGAPI